MATTTISLLSIIITLSLSYTSSAAAAAQPTTSFIRVKCSRTTYPALCVQSLSNYASTIQKNPRQLAQTALSVSLERAQDTKSFMSKLTKFKGLRPREYVAIKDCYEEMSDTVDRLANAVNEMKSIGKFNGNEFTWHMSNVETWVSAALTNGNTCSDGFSGNYMNGRIKNSVRTRVTHVAQVTSNALALINQFATTPK